jgi:hypothetical protein
MRSFRVAWVAGLAVIAFGTLLGAASSQAAEYGRCVSQKKGAYKDENCQTLSVSKTGASNHKGHYEWKPGPTAGCIARKHGEYTNSSCTEKAAKAGKGKFEKGPGPGYTSSSGRFMLAIPSLAIDVECVSGSGAGEVTGTTTDADTLALHACVTASLEETQDVKCTSEGEAEGTIESLPLESRLIGAGEKGPDGKEPSIGEVWTEFAGTSANSGYEVKFSCTGLGDFRVKGSLSGPTNENVDAMSTTSRVAFGTLFGEQDLQAEYSPTGTMWLGPDEATETFSTYEVATSPTEIKT